MAKKILWIEDDYFHIAGLVEPLVEDKYTVEAARSLKEAELKLQNWKNYSLVVLDLIIPYSESYMLDPRKNESPFIFENWTDADLARNGMEIFIYMKEKIEINIPVLVLSVVRNRDIVNRLISLGAVKYIDKTSITPNELKREILELFN